MPTERVSLSLFHLTHLLQVGIGLDEALRELQLLETDVRLRRVWADVAAQVRAGRTLASAMQCWPACFDAVVRALILASELDGDLPAACRACCRHLDWLHRTRSGMLTALVYPVLSLIVLLLVTVFLLVSVVPALSGFLSGNGHELAWHSRALLSVSSSLSLAWWPLACLLGLLVSLLWAWRRLSARFRLQGDRCLLALPLLGPIIVSLSLSRYAFIGARLHDSGVDLDSTLKTGESSVHNRALRSSLQRVRRAVNAGATLAAAMAAEPLLPSAFRRLLGAGESTGALAQAMSQAAEQHLHHAQHHMQRLERLLGPITLMIVGLVLMWIILSLLAPVYESAITAVVLS